jgi:replicative DNA helicase
MKQREIRVRHDPAIIAGRVPPHDLDSEAAVLSACMLDATALDKVLVILKPEHFYSDANGAIFEAIVALAIAQTPVDLVSVASFLRDREKLASVGGASYVAQLADATPAVAHVHAHAAVVYEKWRLRELIGRCQKIAAEGYGDVGVAQDFLIAAEASVYELTHEPTQSSSGLIGPLLQETFRKITEAAERGDQITGIPTGFEKLDAKIAGLHDGDLTIIAARPGMGKTSFVLNLAVNVAAPRSAKVPKADGVGYDDVHVAGYGVAVFSLEMPREQLASRMVCSEGRVDLGKLRQNFLQADDWRRITEAASFLSKLPLWIDDTPGIDLLTLRAKIRRIQAEYNRPVSKEHPKGRRLGLVVIDYLQLMKGRDGFNSREQEISEISRGLKNLAKELGVPIIALSQLNRSTETRKTKDKRPQLSDLRESGAIEQDADNIIFIYRDEYYFAETTNAKGIAELIIAKQRNGPTGKVLTRFTSSCTRFDNLAAGDYPEATADDDE